jgi:3-keto steroid reductase
LGLDYKWEDVVSRIHFLGVELDLFDLKGVYAAAGKIRGEGEGLGSPDLLTAEGRKRDDGKGGGLKGIQIPRLDVLVLNAGIGGWTGIRWGPAVWDVLTNTIQAVTWWMHFKTTFGATAKLQSSYKSGSDSQKVLDLDGSEAEDEPPLGELFTANVFGHYILAHELMPLLSSSPGDERPVGTRGRIIWISSIDGTEETFDPDDLQGLRAELPYNSSKRLQAVLAITNQLPAVQKSSASWFSFNSPPKKAANDSESGSAAANTLQTSKPVVYVAHPGISYTGIAGLPTVLQWCMVAAFYLARWLGSVWHPIDSYKGAVAPVWVALTEQDILDGLEGANGSAKGNWGSSTDRWGNEGVRRTEVGGWGWNGTMGETETIGRKADAKDLTPELREEFEMLGERTWREMEILRKEWEVRLGVRDKKR